MNHSRQIILILLVLAAKGSYCQQAALQEHKKIAAAVLVDSSLKKYPGAVAAKATDLVRKKDSVLQQLNALPEKYFSVIDSKIEKYSGRISKKTEKTLEKLSKWEAKIKSSLEKVSPETAKRLFAADQLSFAVLLQKLKEGETITRQYRKPYDAYRDKLTNSLKYLDMQKARLDNRLLEPIAKLKTNMDAVSEKIDNTEAVQQFIKERKKQLIDGAFTYLGKSRYLEKINKETWYYVETMKNYKELFADESKVEALAKNTLNQIPGFRQYLQQNSMLASLFGSPGTTAAASLEGLQTRTGVQSMIQDHLSGGGPNAQQMFSQQLQEAQQKLTELKKKLVDPALGNGGGTMPDFKPNMEKTKTFKQRLVFGSDIQFAKNNTLLPTTMDIALTVGYKLNEKSVAGLGGSYKLGLGSIDNMQFSNQGINLRSFIDWKLKKQFFISGGYEMNYLAALPDRNPVQQVNYSNWQPAALAGISKKFKVKTKLFKETKMQLLYDFMARQHLPVSQPVLFRVGYNF